MSISFSFLFGALFCILKDIFEHVHDSMPNIINWPLHIEDSKTMFSFLHTFSSTCDESGPM